VVLAEIEGISDTADDGSPQGRWIKNSTFLTRPAGTFTLRTVRTGVTGFFWSYWGERQRWTLLSPGRAAVTIYPDDGYTDVNGPSPSYARLAVTHAASRLAPDGPSLEERRDPGSWEMTLRLPPYAAPTTTAVTRPSPIDKLNTLPAGLASASLFGQQVRALRTALASTESKPLGDPARRLLVRAIEGQRDAFRAAGVLEQEDERVVEAVLQRLADAGPVGDEK
jgi:hypothetical protein